MAERHDIRRRIALEILGATDEAGYCQCPGRIHHSHRNGKRDCRVRLDGAPTLFCVHTSCAGVVEEVNHLLRSRIASAERAAERGDKATDRSPSGYEGCAQRPQPAPVRKVPAFDPLKLEVWARQCRRDISLDWLAERSPVPVPSSEQQRSDGCACSRLFINALYEPGERLLILTRFYSQGDFIAVAGGESYRLGDKPGVKAVPSALPSAGKQGLWFLTAPVTGEWKTIPDPEPRLGRRHEACVTAFRYLLLESDTADEAAWLKTLMLLPLPFAAAYTSGGKSLHALVRVDCESKADFDTLRDLFRSVLCPLGADGAAMTAVRLSRLPGCLRYGKQDADGYRRYDAPRLQRLCYLNPRPPADACLIDLLK